MHKMKKKSKNALIQVISQINSQIIKHLGYSFIQIITVYNCLYLLNIEFESNYSSLSKRF